MKSRAVNKHLLSDLHLAIFFILFLSFLFSKIQIKNMADFANKHKPFVLALFALFFIYIVSHWLYSTNLLALAKTYSLTSFGSCGWFLSDLAMCMALAFGFSVKYSIKCSAQALDNKGGTAFPT